MKIKFLPTDVDSNKIPLQSLKDILRTTVKAEDDKLSALISGAHSWFENKTNYFTRAGTLTLDLSKRDLSGYKSTNERQDSYLHYSNRQRHRENLKFYSPMSANIETGKPTSLIYTKQEDDEVSQTTLTTEELKALKDNTIVVISKEPVEFILNLDQESLPFEFSSLINLQLKLLTGATTPLDPQIEGAILKIASMMYELPDQNIDFLNDQLIHDTVYRFNSTLSL